MYLVHYLYHKWYDNSKTNEGYRVVQNRPSFEENRSKIRDRKSRQDFVNKKWPNIASDCGHSEILRFAKICDAISWQYPKK